MWCVLLVPARFYIFKVNNRNIRKPEICSSLTMRIPERCCSYWLWAYFKLSLPVSIVNFQQVTVSCDTRFPLCLSSISYVIANIRKMFLRMVNVYLIFKLSHRKPKPFEIKVNIDLEGTIVKLEIHIYMAPFYAMWLIKHSGVISSHDPLLPPKKAKLMGVMMGRGKNRLKLV